MMEMGTCSTFTRVRALILNMRKWAKTAAESSESLTEPWPWYVIQSEPHCWRDHRTVCWVAQHTYCEYWINNCAQSISIFPVVVSINFWLSRRVRRGSRQFPFRYRFWWSCALRLLQWIDPFVDVNSFSFSVELTMNDCASAAGEWHVYENGIFAQFSHFQITICDMAMSDLVIYW